MRKRSEESISQHCLVVEDLTLGGGRRVSAETFRRMCLTALSCCRRPTLGGGKRVSAETFRIVCLTALSCCRRPDRGWWQASECVSEHCIVVEDLTPGGCKRGSVSHSIVLLEKKLTLGVGRRVSAETFRIVCLTALSCCRRPDSGWWQASECVSQHCLVVEDLTLGGGRRVSAETFKRVCLTALSCYRNLTPGGGKRGSVSHSIVLL